MRLAPVFVIVLLLAACTRDTAPLTISDVTITRSNPAMQMTAGYFTLTNHTSQAIVITEIRSPQFGSVQMHESVIEDGIARMIELRDLTLHANTSVQFLPGGKHLMLMQAGEDLDAITLDFLAGESIVLSINVEISD